MAVAGKGTADSQYSCRYTALRGYGIGIKLAMLDPTETIEVNSSLLFLLKPFFTQIKADAAYHFKPISLNMNVFDQLDTKTFTYRKTGFGVSASSVIPLSYSWEMFKLSYLATATWIAPLSDTGKTYYPLPYKYTVLAHEGQLYYRNVRSSRIIRSPFCKGFTGRHHIKLSCSCILR